MLRAKVSKTLKVVNRTPLGCRGCSGKQAAGAASGSAGTAKTTPNPVASAPPPPPPPPPPSGGGGGGFFFKFLGVAAVGVGGVVGYAWYDPEFRKTVEKNVPYSDKAFAYLLTRDEPRQRRLPAVQGAGPIVPNAQAVQEMGLARPIEAVVRPPVPEPSPPSKPEPSQPAEEKKVEEPESKRKSEQVEQARQDLKAKEEDEAALNAALETIVSEAASEAIEKGKAAVNALKLAAEAVRSHSEQLKKAMDNADITNKEVHWESMSGAFEAKNEALEKAKQLADQAKEHVEKVRVAIKDGRSSTVTKKNAALLSAEESVNQITYDLNNAVAEKEKARSEAKLITEYRDLVKKGREQFRRELESIMPDVPIKRRIGGKMTEEELNSLIAHAHRRIDQLQKQVAEQQILEQKRLQEALETQKREDEILAESKVFRESDKLRAEFELEKEKMLAEQDVVFEKRVRLQLARQAAAHSDHLREVLKIQEAELHQRYEGILHDRIVAERDKFTGEIAAYVARTKGIESAIDARAEAEKKGRKAQELWLACQALVSTVIMGQGTEGGESIPKPLANELSAIKQAGNDHPFVNTVIASIPDEAAWGGVSTPDSLLNRFHRVRRICRRVAMVDETGGTLFQYLLSFIQAALVGKRGRAFSDEEEIDISELNAFVLLDNASHAVDRGDVEQAVRYMNQLQGQPRRVAADWIKDARLLLETKQAAEALLSHSAANGLGSLF